MKKYNSIHSSDSNHQNYEGGCLCGAIRYRATGEPIGVAHCHCESCRRHTGAVFASGVEFSAKNISWPKATPSISSGVTEA